MKRKTPVRFLSDLQLSQMTDEELSVLYEQQVNLAEFHDKALKAARLAMIKVYKVRQQRQEARSASR